MIHKNNIGIVITSLGNQNYLTKCLKSIFKQTSIPAQIILVIPINKTLNNSFKKLDIYYSKIQNQVHQRNLGISKLSQEIKILIQLDESVILKKDAIQNILKCWNMNENQNVAGIGFNELSQKSKLPLFSRFFKNYQGSVFKNGMCIEYDNIKKITQVSWLKGGITSYDLRKVKNIRNRPFPIISWSVCEDLIFSYQVQKKYKLIICPDAKVILMKKYFNNTNLRNEYYLGKLYSHNFKHFVRINKELSISYYFISILILFFYGICKGVIFFNLKKIVFNFGKIAGLFSKNLFYN